ncbi:SNF5-domain-containing protein [Piromyces finnis]|uniref:SNF5-domain-containing protein n=1 Tax=Piromyces finnis TaxID=1754191 RepID=A0A1Y1VEM2_9FUNG|nr:SNF5-domain-containing protein [Piromyces finnis]|eukprot:ORX54238.1 SNF5-domain-containing protein [Piromyces finnis]
MDPNWNNQGIPLNAYYNINKNEKTNLTNANQNPLNNLNLLTNVYQGINNNNINLLQLQQGLNQSPALNNSQIVGGSQALALNPQSGASSATDSTNIIKTHIPLKDQNKYINFPNEAITISPKLINPQSTIKSSINNLDKTSPIMALPNTNINIPIGKGSSLTSPTNLANITTLNNELIASSSPITQTNLIIDNPTQISYLSQQQQQDNIHQQNPSIQLQQESSIKNLPNNSQVQASTLYASLSTSIPRSLPENSILHSISTKDTLTSPNIITPTPINSASSNTPGATLPNIVNTFNDPSTDKSLPPTSNLINASQSLNKLIEIASEKPQDKQNNQTTLDNIPQSIETQIMNDNEKPQENDSTNITPIQQFSNDATNVQEQKLLTETVSLLKEEQLSQPTPQQNEQTQIQQQEQQLIQIPPISSQISQGQQSMQGQQQQNIQNQSQVPLQIQIGISSQHPIQSPIILKEQQQEKQPQLSQTQYVQQKQQAQFQQQTNPQVPIQESQKQQLQQQLRQQQIQQLQQHQLQQHQLQQHHQLQHQFQQQQIQQQQIQQQQIQQQQIQQQQIQQQQIQQQQIQQQHIQYQQLRQQQLHPQNASLAPINVNNVPNYDVIMAQQEEEMNRNKSRSIRGKGRGRKPVGRKGRNQQNTIINPEQMVNLNKLTIPIQPQRIEKPPVLPDIPQLEESYLDNIHNIELQKYIQREVIHDYSERVRDYHLRQILEEKRVESEIKEREKLQRIIKSPVGRKYFNLVVAQPNKGNRRTKLINFNQKQLNEIAEKEEVLVPIRIDIDLNGVKFRDSFTWNLNETIITPEYFADLICEDFNLSHSTFQPVIVKTIKEQIDEYYMYSQTNENDIIDIKEGNTVNDVMKHNVIANDELDELRMIIKLDIIIGKQWLKDKFEWDLCNKRNNPEEFAEKLVEDLGLVPEFKTAVSHSIREQIQAHVKSLYLSGYQFNGGPILDDDVAQSFLIPLERKSIVRNDKIVLDFAPDIYTLNEDDIERLERDYERESRRKRRQHRGRRTIALPDREPMRTNRTNIPNSTNNQSKVNNNNTIHHLYNEIGGRETRRAAVNAASNIANMVAQISSPSYNNYPLQKRRRNDSYYD